MKQRKMNVEQFGIFAEFLRGEISVDTTVNRLNEKGYIISRNGVFYLACSLAREWVQKGVVYL